MNFTFTQKTIQNVLRALPRSGEGRDACTLGGHYRKVYCPRDWHLPTRGPAVPWVHRQGHKHTSTRSSYHTRVHKLVSHMRPHEACVRRVWWLHSPNLERAPLSRDRTHRHGPSRNRATRGATHNPVGLESLAPRKAANPRAHLGGPNLYDIAEQTIETYGAPGWGNGWGEGCLHP